MRVVVFGLVLVNLLFFGWAEWIDVVTPPVASSIAGLPSLKLVNELPPDQRVALARKMAVKPPAPQCVSVGPFDDPAIAAQAAALLKAKSFAPQQRAAEDPAVRRFWVYLDGFVSDAGEMRVLHRLERAGIDDAEAMPVAAGGRRVSLGLFTDRDGALRRARAVRILGFRPAMSERMLPGTVYWLDLTLANSTMAVPLKDVSSLVADGGSGGRSPISLQPCPTAASESSSSATQSPASSARTSSAATPNTASPGPPLVPATLPLCKPGGAVPCIAPGRTDAPPPVL